MRPRDHFVTARFALYFAPRADGAWGRFGAAALSGEARRYGFHATLKAPFRLARGARLERLVADLDAWCATRARFTLPPLEVARLEDFFALVPASADARIDEIADACVTRFEPFRAPLNRVEIARRLRRPLSARQRELMLRWGYPHVFEQFRFHLSLTGPLRGGAGAGRAPRFPPLPAESLDFDAISLFEEPRPGAGFRLLHRSSLRAAGRLIYIAGPSGAGKDSVIGWAQQRLQAGAPVVFARRTITRAPDATGENHRAVTPAEFEELGARGAFAMAWTANGHRYGIGAEIRDWLAHGLTVVVSGSREYLPQALRDFPALEVVMVNAPGALIDERLQARGRETPAEISARVERGARFPVPSQLVTAEVMNDGDLARAGDELLQLLLRA